MLDIAQAVVPVLIAIFGAIFGLWRYLIVRRDELAWKRTEFTFNQGRYLDTDSDLTEIVQIIDGRHPVISLDALFNPDSAIDARDRDSYRHKFDKFLNLFDRLYYAVFTTETLRLEEIQPLSWYLTTAIQHNGLREYCEEYGFDDVLKLAKALHHDS